MGGPVFPFATRSARNRGSRRDADFTGKGRANQLSPLPTFTDNRRVAVVGLILIALTNRTVSNPLRFGE